MEIDGTQLADDLLQRMQEAHEAPKTSAAPNDGPQEGVRIGDTAPPEPVSRVDAPDATALESKLRNTAEKALRGEFESATDVRAEVVDHILRDRWQSKLGAKKTAKMIRSLKPTLASDPQFTREVDQMLIMAARQLGTRK